MVKLKKNCSDNLFIFNTKILNYSYLLKFIALAKMVSILKYDDKSPCQPIRNKINGIVV